MHFVDRVLRIEGEVRERFVRFIVELLFDDECRRQAVAHVHAVALYEAVHPRAQGNGLYDRRKDRMEKRVLEFGIVLVLLLEVCVEVRKVDFFLDESFIVGAVGEQVWSEPVHRIEVTQPIPVPAVATPPFPGFHSYDSSIKNK